MPVARPRRAPGFHLVRIGTDPDQDGASFIGAQDADAARSVALQDLGRRMAKPVAISGGEDGGGGSDRIEEFSG